MCVIGKIFENNLANPNELTAQIVSNQGFVRVV